MSNRYTAKVSESLKLRGWIDEIQAKALRADNARLKGEVESWRDKYKEEYRIVARVWEALGITTFEQAQPNAIWEHVATLKSTLATYKAAVVEAREALKTCRECFKHESVFLEDYLKTTTHPGVSRLVGDNHDADTMAAFTIATINSLLGDKCGAATPKP